MKRVPRAEDATESPHRVSPVVPGSASSDWKWEVELITAAENETIGDFLLSRLGSISAGLSFLEEGEGREGVTCNWEPPYWKEGRKEGMKVSLSLVATALATSELTLSRFGEFLKIEGNS